MALKKEWQLLLEELFLPVEEKRVESA